MEKEDELIEVLRKEWNQDYLPHEPLIPILDEWLLETKQTRDDLSGGNSTDADIRANSFEQFVKKIYPKLAKFIDDHDPNLYYGTIQMVIN